MASLWDNVVNLSDQLPLYKQDGTPDTHTGGFLVFVLISLVVFAFNTYVNIRQHVRYSDKEVDQRLLDLVDKLPPIQKSKSNESPTTEAGDAAPEGAEGADDDEGNEESISGNTKPTNASDDKNEEEEEQYATYKEKIVAKFPASQAYAKDKSRFGFVRSTWGLIQGLVFLFGGFSPFMWDLSGQWMRFVVPQDYCNDTVQACVFVSVTTAIDTIVSLPFAMYSTFVIEHRHGFNKTTLKTFVKDTVLGLLLQALFGLPIMALILIIIEQAGDYFFIYVSGAVMLITFFMMSIYPSFIAPCYNQFDALPDGSLKSKIESLAATQNFPLTKLFTIDGSKRSAHSNAYLYGFCNNKRIVLFDTLLRQCDECEIVAILGHEIGHWKMGHTVKNMVVSQLQIFLIFYSLSFFVGSQTMYHIFGFNDTPTFIGMSLFLECAFTPLNPLLQFFMSYMTRLYEFQADAYAAKLGHTEHLKVGLVKLQLENLGALAVDPLYSAYHYSHPPVVERLRALDEFEKKDA